VIPELRTGWTPAALTMSSYDRLKNDLPADTTWVDAVQRNAEIKARLAAYQRGITV
jgi:hypothetical protein